MPTETPGPSLLDEAVALLRRFAGTTVFVPLDDARAFLAKVDAAPPRAEVPATTDPNCGTCHGRGRVLHVYARGPGDAPGNAEVPCPSCCPSEPAPVPAPDLNLLRALTGEGGRRTGVLRRAGYLTWQVTEAGYRALGMESAASAAPAREQMEQQLRDARERTKDLRAAAVAGEDYPGELLNMTLRDGRAPAREEAELPICTACGHQFTHRSRTLGGICIGCPCDKWHAPGEPKP